MTKKESKKDNGAPKKEEENTKEKLILFEAVEKHPTKNYIILGALTYAGLINQYAEEEAVYGKEDIKPTITIDELNKIIKNFIGE